MDDAETIDGQLEFDLGIGPAARSTDPDTSRLAASLIRASSRSQRVRLLEVYFRQFLTGPNAHGLTADEAATRAGLIGRNSCYWKRCSELAQTGMIEDTGLRSDGLAGIPQMERALTQTGKRVMESRLDTMGAARGAGSRLGA